jgi:hypothetical protein
MRTISIELFWHCPENENIAPYVDVKGTNDEGVNMLSNFTQENLVYLQRGEDWILCEDIFPIFGGSDIDGNVCDNPRNKIQNVPENVERLHMGHSYQMEIKEGMVTIYQYKFPEMLEVDDMSAVSIKLENYISFFRNYVFVLQNKSSVRFDIKLGRGHHNDAV